MNPRPYQTEAMNALDEYLMTREGNPCVVLPTGAGKTPTMAWTMQRYLSAWGSTRIIVLAHVRELLLQGVDKLRTIWPQAPIGVYSAGLRSRDANYSITFASIQSIWQKAYDFEPWDVVFVDEAHRIPLDGETTYRQFLNDCRTANPSVRVVGWTATPFRLTGGPICGPEFILNEIAYEANVRDLIEEGYLCRLISKAGDAAADVSGVHVRQGEFVASELEQLIDTPDVVKAAIAEAVPMMAARRSILLFCLKVDHARHVSAELSKYGIAAPVVHAGTDSKERARIIDGFTRGEIRAVCNVNVLSEGFDASRVDCVVLLRPTASGGLYYQQVGRGLRTHPDKRDCLVLDFATNILRHGPIDAIMPEAKKKGTGAAGEAPVKKCPNCKEVVPAGSRECVECGYLFPEPEVKHETKPTTAPIITDMPPWDMEVKTVRAASHQKSAGSFNVLRVIYENGMQHHSEWVCIEHPAGSFPRGKAEVWWRKRFPGKPVPATVADALASNLFIDAELAAVTERITVKQVGRYTEVVDVKLKNNRAAMAAGA